jgi:hypothetical protein
MAFFGIISSTMKLSLNNSTLSLAANATTGNITVATENSNGSSILYSWQKTGTNCTINSSSAVSTTITGSSIAGSTTLYCNVKSQDTGVTNPTPECVITWTPGAIINSVTWSIASATTSAYIGAAQSVTVVSVDPTAATYDLATTTATNAGSIASTVLTGNDIYTGTFTSPNLTIGASTITIASSGSTSFAFNGAAQTVAFTVSGVYAADTNYSVSGTSATNCDNYTVTLSETSSNYTLGSPSTFSWAITPTPPANFTVPVPATPTSGQTTITISFSWTAVGGCSYQVWGNGGGGYIVVANAAVGVTSASWTAAVNANYTFYVVANANSGSSTRSRIANVFTGTAPTTRNDPYDSGYANQQPLCLSGTQSGTIGLKNWPQGTYGITISTVFVRNAALNPAFPGGSSLLWGTTTRTIRWNLNGTAVNFPLSTSTSAPNPYAGPTSRAVTTTGTVTYTMVASGTGWSTNNSTVSGGYWAKAEWRWTGTTLVSVPAVACTVSYTA